MKHGTLHAYRNLGCRCDDCLDAERAYRGVVTIRRGKRVVRPDYIVHPSRVPRRSRRDELPTTCWCESAMVFVPRADVLAGRTRTCGLDGCTAELVA